MSEQDICESCGFPMKNENDFGGGNMENKYCAYCCDKNGELKPYDEVLECMKSFVIEKMEVSEEKAIELAKINMAERAAWKNIKN